MAAEGSDDTRINLNLTAEEKQVYGQLFRQADTEAAGIVIGEAAVKFFEKTRLDSRILGEIWQIADRENRGFLTPAGFGVALRLISHAQAGQEPSPNLALQPGPLPRFEGIATTAVVLPTQTPLSAQMSGSGAAAQQLSAQGTGGGATTRVPPLAIERATQYARLFQDQARGESVLSGDKAKRIFERSGLGIDILGRIWQLADTEQRGALVQTEFIIAMHLLTSTKQGTLRMMPAVLPASLYESATRGAVAAASAAGPGIAAASPVSPIARQQSPLAGGGFAASGVPPLPPPPVAAISRQLTGQMRSSAPNFSSPLNRTAASVVTPNVTGDSGPEWLITPAEKARIDPVFQDLDKTKKGYITGEEAVPFLTRSGLDENTLAQVWDLADVNSEGRLTSDTFAVALHLIQQQRQRADGTIALPTTLPANLIPPSMRTQLRTASPSVAQQPQAAPAPLPPPPPQPKSAMDDLSGLDSGPSSTPSLPALSATPVAAPPAGLSDPFASSSPVQPSSPIRSPTNSSTTFKPFVPASLFGRSLTAQATGDSNSSVPSSTSKAVPAAAPALSASTTSSPGPPPPPAHHHDLLDNDDGEASRNLSNDTAELANLSNQISSLSKHMQDTSAHRTSLQTELTQTSVQKKNFEQRLAQLRTLFEKEARDVRALEEQLKTSRTQTRSLQTELGALEASYQDLQTQRQTVLTALQADQQENTSLKERIGVISSEVNQLKPQVDKLKSEARQQKGIVAINRKQLSLGESERDKLKAEAEDLARQNQDLARQIHNASVSSATSSAASPSVASAAGKNPFFRRTGSTDIMSAFSPPPPQGQVASSPALSVASKQPFGGDKSFDDFFGPAPTPPPPAPAAVAPPSVGAVGAPATAAAAVKPQFTGASTGSSSFSAVTAPTSEAAAPAASRQATVASDAAPSPAAAEPAGFQAGFMPFPGGAAASAATEVPAAVSASSTPAPVEPSITVPATTSATPPPATTTAQDVPIANSAEFVADKPASRDETSPPSTLSGLASFGLPAAAAAIVTAATAGIAAAVSNTDNSASPAADAEESKSAWDPGHAQNDSLSDPFSVLDEQQDKAKEDFESAFASFKAARGVESSAPGTDAFEVKSPATPVPASAAPKSEAAINADAAKAFADFNSEFPPISELNHDDESDSDNDAGGFDDDFAPASPESQKTAGTHAPVAPVPEAASQSNGETATVPESASPPPPSTEAAAATAPDVFSNSLSTPAPSNIDNIFSTPTAAAAPTPVVAPAAATTTPAAPAAPAAPSSVDAAFDELDDDFEGLEDAREGSADDDFANISRSGLDDFQSTFDSSPVGKLESRASFGVDNSLDFGSLGTPTTTAGTGSVPPTQNGNGTKAAAGGSDWFSFMTDEQKPAAAAPAAAATAGPLTTGAAAQASTLSRQATQDSGANDDPILQKLTSMGYARAVALSALEKYDYNVDRAANYLASES